MAYPVDATISGSALMSFGFVGANYTVAGLGLNTWGFLWPCDAIWNPIVEAASTTWVGCTFPAFNIETCDD